VLVDTHVHVVSSDHDRYPLSPRSLSGTWYLDAPCSAPELAKQMEASGVDGAILVQGVGAYSYDNRYAVESAQANPGRFVSASCIDVLAPDARERLDHWASVPGMQGIRIFAIGSEVDWLDDPGTFPIWERAAELGLHVIVTTLSEQLPRLRNLLARFPDTAISLDHCGFPDPEKPEPLLALTEFPNLYLKLTTHLLDAATQKWGTPAGIVDVLVDHFGAERIMWGSDFCQTHDRSYAELVELGRRAFAGRSEQERALCLGGTARSLWPGLAASR